MNSLIYKEGKSEIFDLLCDNDICDEYNILKYNLNDINNWIYIEFKSKEDRFRFQCDYNIDLEEEKEGYIREEYIAQ